MLAKGAGPVADLLTWAGFWVVVIVADLSWLLFGRSGWSQGLSVRER
jgi:hypothetical protein